MRKRSRITLVFVCLAAIAMFGGLVLSPASAADSFTGEGDIQQGNSAVKTSFHGVTDQDLILNCHYPPQSQGTDGYAFQLPSAFATGGAQVVAHGSSADSYDLDLSFYDSGCSFIDGANSSIPDESSVLPGGTVFVIADLADGSDVHVCLTVGPVDCGSASASGSATSTATSSATATATATSSATATASATATGSPTTSTSPSTSPSAQAGQISTTIDSDKDVAKYKKPFLLSGTVTADSSCVEPYEVTIERQVLGREKTKTLSTSVPVSNEGTWQFSTKSKFSATYRATAEDSSPSCTSGPPSSVDVLVRPSISVGFAGPCIAPQAIAGTVKPSYPGTKVVLKRDHAKVDSDKLNKRSEYEMTVPSCKGKYKVVWRQQSDKNTTGSIRFRF